MKNMNGIGYLRSWRRAAVEVFIGENRKGTCAPPTRLLAFCVQTKGSAWGNSAYLVVNFSALSARLGLGIQRVRGDR